ncbi:hypothetical protein DMB65_00455 [Flavobacterium cheongpyeongense]|uniref:Uncharacterized protein n=1 Tax=Flavobacterium cheongpyeongense TaxID=2212651 RepID=A0A2V4BXF3_9FLAO|nr:hypothetical protein [Flavobacterium cheongpyeongense]PXY42533.1 hypothetical protein DMB65_00455 [Flavobacterium cheongpyeongense]
MIDVSSVAASFIGADAIPETIGLMYSVKRKDALSTALYTSAIVLPVIASGELRVGQKLAGKLTKDSKIFFRGFVYTLQADGKLAKLSTTYKRGRLLEFFNLSDKTVTTAELDAFAKAFKEGKIANAEIKEVLNESDDIARAIKFKEANNYGKITSTDELIAFLDNVNELTTVTQLEEKGIKSFFRGTTRNKIDNSLFPGSTNAQIGGMSASTDPVKSTIFSIESATQYGGSKGVLQMGLPIDLKNITLSAPNRRVDIELEIIFNTSAENFAKTSKIEISVENARKVVKEVFGIDLPSSLTRDSADHLLRTLPASSLDKSLEFYQKAIKYNGL